MKILIVNDDGYQANGIKMLIEEAVKYGEVVVYSPAKCESAQSHKITIKAGIRVEETNNLNVKAYIVHGSAADCVRIGLFEHSDVDIVLSGVNEGLNVGHDLYYSSTIAAVIQAGLCGKRGIAFSYDKNIEDIKPQLSELLSELITNNSEYNNLLNVNFPVSKYKSNLGIKFTLGGEQRYENEFIIKDGSYFEGINLIEDVNEMTDGYAVNNGYISITNLSLKRTFI